MKGLQRADAERGTGLVSSLAAVAAFLAFLLLAVQLLFNLYATSVVTANAYDAAREVAASADAPGGEPAAIARAEHDARERLGTYASRVHFDWTGTDDDRVTLHIEADNPRLLGIASGAFAFTHVDRTIVVRVERFR